MLEVVLICIAVCADAFAAAYAYGLKGVQIGLLSSAVIGFTGALFLGVSLSAASAVSALLSPSVCTTFSAAVLILIAMKNLADAQPSARPEGESTADDISAKGSFVLAAALSVDSLGVGFGAGVTMTSAHKLSAVLLCLLLGVIGVRLGHFLGSIFSCKASRYKTALLSSAILFLIAVMKLV